MKLHFSDMHMAGAVAHPHVHSFFHRTHKRNIAQRWTVAHLKLTSLVITGLYVCMVAAYLILFENYQTTGVWTLFGR